LRPIRATESNRTGQNQFTHPEGRQPVLNQLSPDVVEPNFDSWIAELERRSITDQALATTVTKQNYVDYFTTKRSTTDQWARDLEKLSAKLSVQE
jgi:hypothetical protein